MSDIHPIRYMLMIPLAVFALLLAFGPLASTLLALADFEHWMWYGALYIATAILALICMGMVYVIRDMGR